MGWSQSRYSVANIYCRILIQGKENNGGEGIPLDAIIHAPNGTQRLHGLARTFQTVLADLQDVEERFDFLIEIAQKSISHFTSQAQPTDPAALETLIYYRSRNRMWRRSVEMYNERTRLMMNLLFSISAQVDNKTNLDIADLTAKIALDTKRDSSSMITIAAVTMVFLPGTFISALFSMVFFNTSTDENGKASLTVTPEWWYFPTITIPLTIIVFAVWQWWRRKREAGGRKADVNVSEKRNVTA